MIKIHKGGVGSEGMARLSNEQVITTLFMKIAEKDTKYLVCKSCCIVCGGSVVVGDVQVVHWVTADHVVAVGRVNTWW